MIEEASWWFKRALARRKARKMGMKAIVVGIRMDGTTEVEIQNEDGDWAQSNLSLEEAEFIRDELTRSIDRHRARGFGIKPEVPAAGDAA